MDTKSSTAPNLGNLIGIDWDDDCQFPTDDSGSTVHCIPGHHFSFGLHTEQSRNPLEKENSNL